jgi:hypothetical protein
MNSVDMDNLLRPTVWSRSSTRSRNESRSICQRRIKIGVLCVKTQRWWTTCWLPKDSMEERGVLDVWSTSVAGSSQFEHGRIEKQLPVFHFFRTSHILRLSTGRESKNFSFFVREASSSYSYSVQYPKSRMSTRTGTRTVMNPHASQTPRVSYPYPYIHVLYPCSETSCLGYCSLLYQYEYE